MPELDFTGLKNIAYKGFETEERRERRDSLLQAGYTIVNGEKTPFTASPPLSPEETSGTPLKPPKRPSEGKTEAFTDHTGTRNYNAAYRAAHDYHRRHSPPTVNREYWRSHTVGVDDVPPEEERYWMEAAEDIGATASAGNNDPLLTGLLSAVYEELEREYNAIRGGNL